MNLTGSLSAFGLPDVFGLLSMTSKSGALRVRRVDEDRTWRQGVVRFRDGRITTASPDEGRQVLVRRLVGSGQVDDDTLREAVDRARAGDVGVARALLESGRVDAEVLRAHAGEQLLDGVFDLLRWPDGDFEFVLDEHDVDDVDVSAPVEEVVGRARAREEEWARITAIIPSSAAVLSAPVRLEQGEGLSLSREEWALLVLVDGRRTLEQIDELTGRGRFGITATAAALVERGLVVVRALGDDDHVGVVQRRLALLGPVEQAPAPQVPPVATGGGPGLRGSVGSDRGGAALGADLTSPWVPDTPAELVERMSSAAAAAGQGQPQAAAPGYPARTLTATRLDGAAPQVLGATAVDAQAPAHVVQRDPAVNRSLLLRLIAGVKGL